MGRRVKISPCTCTNAAICAMMGQGVLSMTVTFCGHAQISQSEKIEKWLYDVTQKLIEQGATTFYLGGYGAFDSLAASVLREQKKQYPQIELVLVLAYLNTGRNTSGYDSTVYPPLETVPRRFAISHILPRQFRHCGCRVVPLFIITQRCHLLS